MVGVAGCSDEGEWNTGGWLKRLVTVRTFESPVRQMVEPPPPSRHPTPLHELGCYLARGDQINRACGGTGKFIPSRPSPLFPSLPTPPFHVPLNATPHLNASLSLFWCNPMGAIDVSCSSAFVSGLGHPENTGAALVRWGSHCGLHSLCWTVTLLSITLLCDCSHSVWLSLSCAPWPLPVSCDVQM